MGERLPKYDATQEKDEQAKLVKNIAQQEEQIKASQREKAGHEKRIKQVESSNTWKLGNIVNPISSFWNKLFNRKDREKLAQLEAQIIAQTAKIEHLEEN